MSFSDLYPPGAGPFEFSEYRVLTYRDPDRVKDEDPVEDDDCVGIIDSPVEWDLHRLQNEQSIMGLRQTGYIIPKHLNTLRLRHAHRTQGDP